MKNFLLNRMHEVLAITVVVLLVASTFLMGSSFLRPSRAVAGASQNVSGWAWSDNIGWVSFNSSSGGGPDHGVNIDMATGDFSGYAWSDNIGWVSFNPADLGGCPAAPCKTNANIGTGAVTGWARALTYGAGSGWISFSSAASGNTTINTSNGAFSGWAWSDDFGWMDMSRVVGPTLYVPPAPTINIVAVSPVVSGGQSNVTWTTTNATSCTAAGGSAGWTASGNSINGSWMTAPLSSGTYVYALNCTGPGGANSNSATVIANSPVPTVSISASPLSNPLNTPSTITWSTTNATGCVASGGTAGWVANGSTTGGSWTTGALTAGPHTYSLNCSGPGGNVSGNVTVNTATFNCGDGTCQTGESILTCPVDCKSTVKQF